MALGDTNLTNLVLSGNIDVAGQVRSTGITGNTLTQRTYQTTLSIANGQTTGKEASILMPANFLPLLVAVHVTVAATNAVNLVDIGVEGDTDAFVDGATIAANSTGFKGVFSCNGVRGFAGGTANSGALGTADEVSIVCSADPGATGITARLTFLGWVAT